MKTPWERGEHGDHGQTGDHGLTGDRGPDGKTGDDGDRGKTGIDGERGKQGDSGRDGREGLDGKVGERGEQGDPGPSPTFRLLVMFVFVIVIFLGISLLVGRNTAKVDDNRKKDTLIACERARVIQVNYNTLLDNLARIDREAIRTNDDPSLDESRTERIEIYEAARTQVTDCTEASP